MVGGQSTGTSMNKGSFGDTSSSSGKGSSTFGKKSFGTSNKEGKLNIKESEGGIFMAGQSTGATGAGQSSVSGKDIGSDKKMSGSA